MSYDPHTPSRRTRHGVSRAGCSFYSCEMLHFKLLPFVFAYCFCLGSNVLGSTDITVKNCGTSIFPQKPAGRIVGGKDARHGQHPWMVSLHENASEGFEHVCGAVVLNKYWIISAAHCILFDNEGQPLDYEVLMGLQKQSEQDAKTVQRIKVSNIVLHEKYDNVSLRNDIALLRTAKPIDIAGSKGYVNGICLPDTDEDPTGNATIAGWGRTQEDGQKSDILKEAEVPIIARDECEKAINQDRLLRREKTIETKICAGMSGKSPCMSDSGGPLIQKNKQGAATLIGIVSYGSGCDDKSDLGVYTKVAAFKKWIQMVVSEKMICCSAAVVHF